MRKTYLGMEIKEKEVSLTGYRFYVHQGHIIFFFERSMNLLGYIYKTYIISNFYTKKINLHFLILACHLLSHSLPFISRLINPASLSSRFQVSCTKSSLIKHPTMLAILISMTEGLIVPYLTFPHILQPPDKAHSDP